MLDQAGTPSTFHASVVTAAGGVFDVRIDWPGGDFARAEGAADADADGRDEAFVMLDRGASTEFLTMYRLGASTIERVRFAGGDPFSFAFNGSVTHGNGLECTDTFGGGGRELVVLTATTQDTVHYQWSDVVYRWDHGTLRVALQHAGTLTRRGNDDPRIQRFWQLQCGKLHLE